MNHFLLKAESIFIEKMVRFLRFIPDYLRATRVCCEGRVARVFSASKRKPPEMVVLCRVAQ